MSTLHLVVKEIMKAAPARKDHWTKIAEFVCDDEPEFQDRVLDAVKRFIDSGCLGGDSLAREIEDIAGSASVTLSQYEPDSDDHQDDL